MNILILNWRDLTHPKSGGAELVTMEHANGWVRRGHSVTLLTGWYGGKKEETINGVHIVRRAGSLKIYPYAVLYVLLNGRKFDVIVDEAHGFPYFSPLFTRTPVILFIHEIAGEIWDYMFSFPKNLLGKVLEALYFRIYRNHLVWTDAPSTVKELVERGFVEKNCFAIPCPIIGGVSDWEEKSKKESHPTYLFVSRVVRMKGIEEVIKAFSFIARNQKDAQLWIIGGGEEEYIAELKHMIEEYGIGKHVTFFGQVSEEEKYNRMRRAHLLLHASVKEGWGLVVLEAASVGTPSVVYNVPGLCDVVQHGKTGIVIMDNSPQDMATEVVGLYGDHKRYSQFQKNGIQWAKTFLWKDVIDRSEQVLQQACEKNI